MTLEQWIEELLDRAVKDREETFRIAMNSYGHGYNVGLADGLQKVFAMLPREAAGIQIDVSE